MRVKLRVEETSLKNFLKKDNKKIISRITGNENTDKVNAVFLILLEIMAVIAGAYALISADVVSESITILGTIVCTITVIINFKFKDKFSVEYIEKERIKTIKERNKDVLLATGNFNKEEFLVEGVLELKDNFIEISFGKLKKVYGINSLKKVYLEKENLVLQFKNIKYFINENSFTKEEVQVLLDLNKLHNEKFKYTIQEKITQTFDLKNYYLINKKELDLEKFFKKLKEKENNKLLYTSVLPLLGIAISLIGLTGVEGVEGVTIIIIFMGLIILMIKLKANVKGKDLIKLSGQESKFLSNLDGRDIKIYLGEIYDYIFIDDEITIVSKEDLNIIEEEYSLCVEIFKEKLFDFKKKLKEEKIILDMEKCVTFDEKMEMIKENIKNQVKRIYENDGIKKITFIAMGIIFVASGISIKSILGAGTIALAYTIFFFYGKKLEKGIVKITEKLKDSEKEKKDNILNIKIFEDKVTIKEKDYLKVIVGTEDIEFKEEFLTFGYINILKEKFTKEEFKIISGLKGRKNKAKTVENKEITFKGTVLEENRQKLQSEYQTEFSKIIEGIVIAVFIAGLGVGIGVSETLGIMIAIISVVLGGTVKMKLKENIKKLKEIKLNMYISESKLYVERLTCLEEYNIDNLNIVFEEEGIIIKNNLENLFLVEDLEEIKGYFENRKISL